MSLFKQSKFIIIGVILLNLNAASLPAETSPIKPDEVVILFPTIGYPMNDEMWALHIHGWIYEPQSEGTTFMRRLLGLQDQDNGEESLFQERAAAFFVDNERGKRITLRLGEKRIRLNNKSSKNGHFSEILPIPAAEIDTLRHSATDFISVQAVTRANDSRRFEGKIKLLDKEGLSVISDIDDTIKISEVRDKRALLANTFMRPFQPVPNMADFYNSLAEQQENVTFHYVSASPWQLYQPLHHFMTTNGFPAGSFHLRPFRWKDSSFFKFFKSSYQHKITTIQSLITCCVGRRVILIGDSGEYDPEIYAEIARQYPEQVIRILIRDVTEEGEQATRYQQTFKGLPKSLWSVIVL